jgi:hypothetical protein
MRTIKLLTGIATLLVLHAVTAALPAADRELVAKARDYVESAKVSKIVLGLMHVGTSYKGHEALDVLNVTDGRGRKIPGAFAVKVRVYWGAGAGGRDWTDVFYFFNAKGRFNGLKSGDTTAILNQPFALGGLAIELLKGALIDELKKKRDTKELIELIEKADAKNLTEIMVALRQP